MQMRKLATIAGLVAAAQMAQAADWPQWRGPSRDGVAPTSPPLAGSWPTGGPHKLWEYSELRLAPSQYAGGASSPVVANGKVYAYVHDVGAPKDTVLCLSFRTGKLLWRRDFEGQQTWSTP